MKQIIFCLLMASTLTATAAVPDTLELTLDDGTGTPRTVASGIALYYKPEELIGHNVIVVANLKPATFCGVESRGMILAGGEDDVKVVFVDYLEPGTKIR